MVKVSNFIPSSKFFLQKFCKRDVSLPLCLLISACAQWVGGECNLPWSARSEDLPSICVLTKILPEDAEEASCDEGWTGVPEAAREVCYKVHDEGSPASEA